MDHLFTFNTHSVDDRNYTNIPGGTNDPNIPNDTENDSQCGGVLGIYRITLWIIVMTSTIFSMIMQYY